nr:unnamed protein product [Spirometra erinaceieuropaei]
MLVVDRKCKTRDQNKKQKPLSPTAPPPAPPHPTCSWVSPLNLAAWNVSSFLDNPGNNQLERRTAIVTSELTRYKVDVTDLRVVRFSKPDQLVEMNAEYTLLWSDCLKTERCGTRIFFAIHEDIVTKMFATEEDIKECQPVIFVLLHPKLYVREDRIQTFLECQQLIPVDNDEGIIYIPGPELRSVVLKTSDSNRCRTVSAINSKIDCSFRREERHETEH